MGFLCPWDSGNVDRLPPHPAADRRGNPERPAESGPTQTDFQRRSCPGPSQRPRNLHNTHCYFKVGMRGWGDGERGRVYLPTSKRHKMQTNGKPRTDRKDNGALGNTV